jgi:hypothetical protein
MNAYSWCPVREKTVMIPVRKHATHIEVSRELADDSQIDIDYFLWTQGIVPTGSARRAAEMLTTSSFSGDDETRGSGRYPHGKSVKNPATYEALKAQGMSKSKAAAISNAAAKKGKKGTHHKGRGK